MPRRRKRDWLQHLRSWEPGKLEGPSTCLTFLGIEVDTQAFQLRLPEEKLTRLRGLLNSVMGRKAIMKRDLQSVVGLLQHAAKVVKPGRSFMRRLHALLAASGLAPNHFIRLNMTAQADILWWQTFVSEWNGVSMVWAANRHRPDLQVVSDASGTWECGSPIVSFFPGHLDYRQNPFK